MRYSSRQIGDAVSIIDPLLRLSSIYGSVPGMAYGLSYGDETVLLASEGVADVETGEPVDAATTAFRCASITKTLTGTIIMQLVERGKLRLDDSVISHLAWTKKILEPDLTVRHLLVHAGGVIRDGSNAWLGEPMPDRETLRRELSNGATFAEPSEHFRYSNIAYSLLGEIAEVGVGAIVRNPRAQQHRQAPRARIHVARSHARRTKSARDGVHERSTERAAREGPPREGPRHRPGGRARLDRARSARVPARADAR